MSQPQNQLRAWMDMYDQSGMGAQNEPGYNLGSQFSVGRPSVNNNGARMAWALQRMNEENGVGRMPDFFGGGAGGMANAGAQMPPQQANPYTPRATQLNNDPYSGQGDQQGILNYLRQMMMPREQPRTRSNTTTMGMVRG